MENEHETPLNRAIEALGNQSKLAVVCGCTQQTVSTWVKGGKPIPAEYVVAIEKATGIPRAELRPDLFATEAAE